MHHKYELLYRLYEREWFWFVARHDLISKLLTTPNTKVLEIGCSSGSNSKVLTTQTYYGIDISQDAIKSGNRSKNLIIGTAYNLPFHPQSFDTILFLDVLEHLDSEYIALKEAHRVLKPQGTIITLVPAFAFLWDAHDDLNEHKRRYTKPTLASLMKPFKITKLTYWNSFLFFPIAIMKLLKKNNSNRPDNMNLPKSINTILLSILKIENYLITKDIYLPIGISLLCTARRNKKWKIPNDIL